MGIKDARLPLGPAALRAAVGAFISTGVSRATAPSVKRGARPKAVGGADEVRSARAREGPWG
ncbi:MAG: hypothetical protein FalmKO_16540 [Falsiruegeria mediterranea]